MENLISDEGGKKSRNLYLKAWRKKNPEKIRAIAIRYWAKRAIREQELSKQANNGK